MPRDEPSPPEKQMGNNIFYIIGVVVVVVAVASWLL